MEGQKFYRYFLHEHLFINWCKNYKTQSAYLLLDVVLQWVVLLYSIDTLPVNINKSYGKENQYNDYFILSKKIDELTIWSNMVFFQDISIIIRLMEITQFFYIFKIRLNN
jgi:hypothetical protein